MPWEMEMAGWYVLRHSEHEPPVAAVCLESHNPPWCAYIHESMPPGDAQFRTLKEAKEYVEKQLGGVGSHHAHQDSLSTRPHPHPR
jgi:hypothetical protein